MYTIKKSSFIISKADGKPILNEYPKIAVCGKSNVGKSSLINYLANNSKLARTSKEPGRTRLINYFLFNEEFVLVDLPGYGYARVSQNERDKWEIMIEEFFNSAENALHIFFLVDIRHDPTDEDAIMYNYLFKSNLPFTIIATKSDKLSRAQCNGRLQSLATFFKVGIMNIIPFSVNQPKSREQVYAAIENILEVSNEPTVQ